MTNLTSGRMFLLVIILRQTPDKAGVRLALVGVSKMVVFRGVRSGVWCVIGTPMDRASISILGGGVQCVCASTVHGLGGGLTCE